MSPATHPACPPEVLDWIAWYPEGDLPDAVRAAVERHAAECVACRREIDLVHGEAAEIEEALPDADALFRRVLARLEEEAATAGPPAAPTLRPPRRAGPARRALLAAGLAGIVASAALGAWVAGSLDAGAYRTASAPPAVSAGPADGPTLQVVFREDAAFGRVASALRETDARILAGPGPSGVVRLALPAGADPHAVAARLRGEDGVARFAEPVGNGATP